MSKNPRILVIRGGAIGDFILTLPALNALRERWREARIEILGYSHIVELAVGRHYAQASRSIEYGALSGFFAPNTKLDEALGDYFAGFDLVVSYLYDPDKFFEENLRRVGVRHLVVGSAKPSNLHAAAHYAKPLESLAIYAEDLQPRVHLSQEDLAFGKKFVAACRPPRIAVHCGSGSARKNWSAVFFAEVCRDLRVKRGASVICVSGEADATATAEFLLHLGKPADADARNLRLTELAGVMAQCQVFIGNDSGISHLAAAVGVPTVVLWYPGSSPVWQPRGEHVRIIPFNRASPQYVGEVIEELLEGRATSEPAG
jgi:heptosyltransferase-2